MPSDSWAFCFSVRASLSWQRKTCTVAYRFVSYGLYDGTAYTAMEQQLEVLGVRWTSVCRWMEERSVALTEAASRWRVFSERLQGFVSWLSDTEDVLADIERRWTTQDDGLTTTPDETVADVHDVVEQVQCLKVYTSAADLLLLDTALLEWSSEHAVRAYTTPDRVVSQINHD